MTNYQLNMKIGPTPGKLISLGRAELLIGRELSNDIVISDADVSRRHARLVQQGDSYLLEDVGSTNGTFVNGQRLTAPQLLKPGDRIRLGETVELAYEKSALDSDVTRMKKEASEFEATMLAEDKPAEVKAPAAYQSPPPPPPAVQPQSYGYASPEPVSAAPAYDPATPDQDKSKRNLRIGLIAGAGCLLLLCLCAVSAYLIYTYVIVPNL